ncbi:MAG: hypothetical protein ABWY68_09375 [Cryobacterium sp.]
MRNPSIPSGMASAMRFAGRACVLFAVVLFVASVVVFAIGIEVAVLPMIFAFGVFTLGIGALAAAKRG